MISVILPAYNEAETLDACLAHLAAQQWPDAYEVIVVDNDSSDDTAARAQAWADRLHVRVVHEGKRGRGAARATGCSAARGEILLWTDADTLVPPHWAHTLVHALYEHPTWLGVTTGCVSPDAPGCSRWLFPWVQRAAAQLYRLTHGHPWLNGFSTAVRTTAYVQSGGFHSDLDSQEDVELSRRLARLGTLVLLPTPRVSVSGRRFKHGLLRGLSEYLVGFIAVFALGRSARLSNPR